MDLKLKDVAELLSVAEETVHRWLAEERIPHYKMGEEYRFSPTEIEDWLMVNKVGAELDKESVQKGNMQFNLYRALYRGNVLIDVPGESKEEIFRRAMQVMAEQHGLDAEVLTDLFLDRETSCKPSICSSSPV